MGMLATVRVVQRQRSPSDEDFGGHLARSARSGILELAHARSVSSGPPPFGGRCRGQCQEGLVFGEGSGPSQVGAKTALSLWVHQGKGGVSSRCP